MNDKLVVVKVSLMCLFLLFPPRQQTSSRVSTASSLPVLYAAAELTEPAIVTDARHPRRHLAHPLPHSHLRHRPDMAPLPRPL